MRIHVIQHMPDPLLKVRYGVNIGIKVAGSVTFAINIIGLQCIEAMDADHEFDSITVCIYHHIIKKVEDGIVVLTNSVWLQRRERGD